MDDTTWAVLAWCLAVVLLGWTWLPALLSGLGWHPLRQRRLRGPDTTARPPTEPDSSSGHRQLVAWGYKPLGTGWMRLSYYGADWRYESRRPGVSLARPGHVRIRSEAAAAARRVVADHVCHLLARRQPALDQQRRPTIHPPAAIHPPGDGEHGPGGRRGIAPGRGRSAAGRRPAHRPGRQSGNASAATTRHAGPQSRHTGVKLGQNVLARPRGDSRVLSIPVAAAMGFGDWARADRQPGPRRRSWPRASTGETPGRAAHATWPNSGAASRSCPTGVSS